MDPLEREFGMKDAELAKSMLRQDRGRFVFKFGPFYIGKGIEDHGLGGGRREYTIYGIRGLGELRSEKKDQIRKKPIYT